MPTVNVHEAKTQLSRLLAQVEAGVLHKPRGRRRPDLLKGKIVIPDSFFDPLSEEELKSWDGE